MRGTAVREVVGGKGNNVARALKRLGRSTRPVTFLGGPAGELCAKLLREDDQLEPIAVSTAAATRVILTVRTEGTDEQSAFFDPDPSISSDEADALLQRVAGALAEGEVEALTLSGSSPSKATDGLYSDLISLAQARRIPVFLDTYGAALTGIWGFWPQVMQLNRREAGQHLRKPAPGQEDLKRLLDNWARHGVRCGVVTDGPNEGLVRIKGQLYRVTPPRIRVVNPIGSGDCLLAGLVDGWLSGLGPEELIRHAFGCAAANAIVWDAGAIDPDSAARLANEVRVETLAS